MKKQEITRIAIVSSEKCKPSKCKLECQKGCPVNRMNKDCIVVKSNSVTAKIEENLCIGCGICTKKCPFKAITIINLPTNLDKDTSFRFGQNTFKLHRLPVPKIGKVLGLVGTNGIGKTTALKILSGKIRPNFGKYDEPIDWSDVAKYYKGSELHGYFIKFLEGNLITANKIQYINDIPRILCKMLGKATLTVNEVLDLMDERSLKDYYIKVFDLSNILDRDLNDLSGGELQRFSISVNCMKDANVYVFDEPTSFLDVKQRLTAANEIRKLSEGSKNRYVLVIEHDLAILDLVSDYGCVLYGDPGVYGVVSSPFAIKSAINIFLDGYLPTENIRFRDNALKFNIPQLDDEVKVEKYACVYLGGNKTYAHKQHKIGGKDKNEFKLMINQGTFSNSEITVLLGENGMGKSTFVHLLAGVIKDDQGTYLCDGKTVSLKPQKISPKFKGTVRDLFNLKVKCRALDSSFQNEVIRPLNVDHLMDNLISSLSGGELQRISIIICLAKEADIYLLDEPAAFLDSDQRISICKLIRRFVYLNNKSAFIVEHDLVVATYLADRVVLFEGTPGVSSVASEPMDVKNGLNRFLKSLNITFRRDPTNFRPRINKFDSSKDKQQKASGEYYFV